MSDEGVTERCARCGAGFAATASPLGLCPACLLKLGMSDPGMIPPPEPVPEVEPFAPMTPVPAPPQPRRSWRPSPRAWKMAAVAAVIVAAVLSLFLPPRREVIGPHTDPVRFTVTLPDRIELMDGAQFAVSADGAQLAVAARSAEGQQHLWVRRLQSLDWRELPRTDGASFPFWSPDGRSIAFFAGRSLKRVDVSNDLTHAVCDAPSGRGGSWSSLGVIVFAGADGLFRVPASGGSPERVTQVDAARGEIAHLWPQFVPDGRRVVFVGQQEQGTASTYLLDLNTSQTVSIADGRGQAALVSDLLLFSRGNTLAAQRIDVTRGLPRGDARSIGGTDDIASAMTGATFSASSTVLVYRRHEPRPQQLTWFDRTGRMLGTQGTPADDEGFALSPDGMIVAVARRDARDDASNIWVMDIRSERSNRLTLGPTRDVFPVWSADGSRIAFSSRRDHSDDVYTVAANGGGKEQVLLRSPESKRVTDWSGDGRFVIYTARSANTGTDVWALPLMAENKPQPVDLSLGNQSQAVLSPDGRSIAYVSDESGSDEVYVRTFPPSEGRWQISTHGGTRPRWRADGRELFFLSAGRVMAVDIARDSAVSHGGPQPVFVVPGATDFAVRHDRFLIQMPLGEPRAAQLHVVLNWASELRR